MEEVKSSIVPEVKRVCKKCQEVKPLSQFAITKSRAYTAHKYTCQLCHTATVKAYNKAYYQRKKS